MDSDLLTPSINHSITDPLLFNGSLSFSLPTDKTTKYSVTLTDENGIDLVFGNISISEFIMCMCVLRTELHSGTFDIQDLQVSKCLGSGCITVKIVFVEGTFSPGALVCVVRISNGSLDFANIKLVTIPRSTSESFTNINITMGKYRVIAFDLEINFILRIPITMAADSKNMTVATSGGLSPLHCTCVFTYIMVIVGMTSPPPSSEGISLTKLPNGYAQVTCSDSVLNCLVLFQPTKIVDRLLVGFINTSVSSTIHLELSLNYSFGDGYLIVYSWINTQSIFDGKISLITQLKSHTSE